MSKITFNGRLAEQNEADNHEMELIGLIDLIVELTEGGEPDDAIDSFLSMEGVLPKGVEVKKVLSESGKTIHEFVLVAG